MTKIKKMVKYIVLFIGLLYVFTFKSDHYVDERILGVLLIWMTLDLTRKN